MPVFEQHAISRKTAVCWNEAQMLFIQIHKLLNGIAKSLFL